MIRRLWWVPFLLVALLVACSTGDDADAYLDGAASATASAGERYIVVLSRAPGTASAVANRAEAADVAAQTVPTGIQRIFADSNGNMDIDGTDDYRVDVDVAVIDTGVDFQHPDLNVAGGVNCSRGQPVPGQLHAGRR
jgi:subtilisin family serine protease